MSADYEIETRVSLPFGVQVQVPVEIDLPRTAVELCQWHYECAQEHGHDPHFEDYLLDLVQMQFVYTVDGDIVAPETGELVEEDTTEVNNE